MIDEIFQKLAELPSAVWDTYALRNEPLREKLTAEQKIEFLDMAHTTGIRLAHEIEDKFPGQQPFDIAVKLGLKVNYLPETDDGNYIKFACYTEPDKIEIYKKTIDTFDTALKEENCTWILNETDIGDILLTHELYHYFEFTKPELATNQKLLTLWHIGKFEYKSSVISLKEIGAMAFTRELLHLQYSPYIFDILLLYPQNKEFAIELFDYVRRLAEK